MTNIDSDEYVDSIPREIHAASLRSAETNMNRLPWRCAAPIILSLSLALWAAIIISIAYLAAGILS